MPEITIFFKKYTFDKEVFYLKSPLYFLSSCPKTKIFKVKYTNITNPIMDNKVLINGPILGNILNDHVNILPNPKKKSVILN